MKLEFPFLEKEAEVSFRHLADCVIWKMYCGRAFPFEIVDLEEEQYRCVRNLKHLHLIS